MAEVQYATNGKGNLGVTLGAIGTGLGAVSAAGGLAGLLGVRPNGQGGDPGDRPVTRYEMDLIRENMAKDAEIASLEAKQYTDGKIADVRAVQAEQAVHNATVGGAIAMIKGQVDALLGMTRMFIPNSNVAPGWGPAFVVPGVPPIPTVQTTPPTVSSGSTAAAA